MKVKKIILLITLFILTYLFQDAINHGTNEDIKKIYFQGVVLDVRVCYKNYLCVKLLKNKDDIKLSTFSCVKGDDILKGDSLVKKGNDLFMSVYRKNNKGKFFFKRDYSTSAP